MRTVSQKQIEKSLKKLSGNRVARQTRSRRKNLRHYQVRLKTASGSHSYDLASVRLHLWKQQKTGLHFGCGSTLTPNWRLIPLGLVSQMGHSLAIKFMNQLSTMHARDSGLRANDLRWKNSLFMYNNSWVWNKIFQKIYQKVFPLHLNKLNQFVLILTKDLSK